MNIILWGRQPEGKQLRRAIFMTDSKSLLKAIYFERGVFEKVCKEFTHSRCNIFWKYELPNANPDGESSTVNGNWIGMLEQYTDSIHRKKGEIFVLRKRKKDFLFHSTKAWGSIPRTPKCGQHGTWPMKYGSVIQGEILWLYLLFTQFHAENKIKKYKTK